MHQICPQLDFYMLNTLWLVAILPLPGHSIANSQEKQNHPMSLFIYRGLPYFEEKPEVNPTKIGQAGRVRVIFSSLFHFEPATVCPHTHIAIVINLVRAPCMV